MKDLALPAVRVIELSSTTTLVMMVVSLLQLEHHPGVILTYEEDPSKELSIAVSHAPHVAKPSYVPRERKPRERENLGENGFGGQNPKI